MIFMRNLWKCREPEPECKVGVYTMIKLVLEETSNFPAFTIDIFGRDVRIDWRFGAEQAIHDMRDLIEKTSKMMDVTDIGQTLSGAGGNCYYGNDVVRYVTDALGCPYSYPKIEWWLDNAFNVDDAKTKEVRERMVKRNYRKEIVDSTYFGTLSHEAQSIIVDEANSIIKELEQYIEDYDADKLNREETAKREKDALLDGVEWDVSQRTVSDEGGKTAEYTHKITINGRTYTIIERNVFDFGRVMNSKSGGMYSRSNGKWVIERFSDGSGWISSPISDDEARAVEIVSRYGEYSNSPVRM